MPPAPERLSTTTDLPRSFSSACATGRAARSACPPGGNGTTIVMLRKGQPCAAADEKKRAIIGDAKVDPTSAPCRNLRRCISILPGVISFPRTGRFPRLWQVCSANDLFGRVLKSRALARAFVKDDRLVRPNHAVGGLDEEFRLFTADRRVGLFGIVVAVVASAA